MTATVIERHTDSVTIQIKISLCRSMLDTEESIQTALNEAGQLATGEALQQFDTDGSPILISATTWYSKGQEPKTYQSPYGTTVIERYVYQTCHGGPTYCPLERDARIILTATPRFAKQVSHKYAETSPGRVVTDLLLNYGRAIARSYAQSLAEAVASVALAKEESWRYATPKFDAVVQTIGIGLDGTCILMVKEGQRQAMVGTISLYDKDGSRLHTLYVAATPEYGKATFYQRLSCEIGHVRELYPTAQLTGVADGASDNWTFLGQYTDDQVVDFYHATKYLGAAAKAASPRSFAGREQWLDDRCHRLKHEEGAAVVLLAELEKLLEGEELKEGVKEELQDAITYFRNHQGQMGYADRVQKHLPIGSGVTEAACKTIVKQRLCKSGQKWKEEGAGMVLSLRSLSYSEGRWEQFWSKMDRYGFPVAA